MTATLLRSALLLVLPLSIASGQKNCRKGIPCGNTCIAANKTCRIGSPTRPAAAPTKADSSTEAAPAIVEAWVASSIGATYYRAGCTGARKLSRKNLIYFKTEEAAQKAGYRHSVQKGC